ncbi:reverse transcriptase-like protein [Nitzschia inconspicua]|uniref:Reverse transcriptase-like protein n=1 Tax=Nitzschia inconspicua TaxID=303405 RepID=A0A9K3PW27_9STRA|nr:reverse transcriptase-like protein [Nitzschia inconspicua]
MIPSMLSPSVRKESLTTTTAWKERLLASKSPAMEDEEKQVSFCFCCKRENYRKLILNIRDVSCSSHRPHVSGFTWTLYDDSDEGYNKVAESSDSFGANGGLHDKDVIAGYWALIQGLDFLLASKIRAANLLIESESKPIISQMVGASQVKNFVQVILYGAAKKRENALKYNGVCRRIHFHFASYECSKVNIYISSKRQ